MLQGFHIIEIEGLGPAQFAGMMFADLGAKVTVVHRPGGSNPAFGEVNVLDRGKRSIVLDLKDHSDVEVARSLILTADAVLEGFRPGVMERLGLGPDVFTDRNPKLVYGRMTGWGQNGPKAQEAGHDLNYIAASGALWYASDPGSPPRSPPTLVGDVGGGALYLVVGVLAALLNANRTGNGCVVDAAIVDGSAHMMALLMSMAPSGNLLKERGTSLLDGPHWSRCYASADRRYISVQCLEPESYRVFLEVLGLSTDPLFSTQFEPSKWPEQTVALETVFSARPASYWHDAFLDSDACVAVVLSPDEAANTPHMRARRSWQYSESILQPAPAPRFDGQVKTIAKIPERDGNRNEVLNELGL